MHKRIIIISLFFNISSLFASEQTSKDLPRNPLFKTREAEIEYLRHAETARLLNSYYPTLEEMVLREKINNYCLGLKEIENEMNLADEKARLELRAIIQKDLEQQSSRKVISAPENTSSNPDNSNASIPSINTTKTPESEDKSS